jgi:hypothetical protein
MCAVNSSLHYCCAFVTVQSKGARRSEKGGVQWDLQPEEIIVCSCM